jgi:hypothetical protein
LRWPTRGWCWRPGRRRGSGNPSRRPSIPRDTCRWWEWASGGPPARAQLGTPSLASLVLRRAPSSDPNSGMQGTRRPYSRISWKVDSQKSICRTVHRVPVLRPIRPLRTLRTQTSACCISDPGIMMRSDQYAAPREHSNRGRGRQELRPPV